MYIAHKCVGQGAERGRGRQIIRWTFDKRLGENHTPSAMAKCRQHTNSAFYIHYSYAYVLVKNETRLYDKQERRLPWINIFPVAER